MSNKKQLQENNETLAAVRSALSSMPTVPEIEAKINSKAPMYTYGTEDLVAGETPLEHGKLHFVYEP